MSNERGKGGERGKARKGEGQQDEGASECCAGRHSTHDGSSDEGSGYMGYA